jgi:hypothetical protein
MFTFLTVVLYIVGYLVLAGITHGYAKHRWPTKIVKRQVYVQYSGYEMQDQDDNSSSRVLSTIFWPFYWTFIWPFTKANEMTFDRVEKHAALCIAKNKVRIADLRATREQLAASNAEMEAAEVEVEKEMAKL